MNERRKFVEGAEPVKAFLQDVGPGPLSDDERALRDDFIAGIRAGEIAASGRRRPGATGKLQIVWVHIDALPPEIKSAGIFNRH
jgi:hypothetical protein